MSKIAVVCYYEKACRILIQSADREKIFLFKLRRKKVNDGLLLFIVGCGQYTGRLIEHIVAEFLVAHGFPVKLDARRIAANLMLRRCYHDSVNTDASVFYYLSELASRERGALGKQPVKSHKRHMSTLLHIEFNTS